MTPQGRQSIEIQLGNKGSFKCQMRQRPPYNELLIFLPVTNLFFSINSPSTSGDKKQFCCLKSVVVNQKKCAQNALDFNNSFLWREVKNFNSKKSFPAP